MRDEGRNGAVPTIATAVSVLALFAVAIVAATANLSGGGRIAVASIATAAAATTAWGIWASARRRRAHDLAERDRFARLFDQTAQLEESVAGLEAILSAVQEGLVLFAPDNRVAYANPAARDLLGRRFSSASELTPAVLREAVQQVALGEGRAERVFETTGRTVEALVVRAEPPGTVVVVARDVTAARRTDQLRRDFVANASHELKTPVASILALAETLRQAAADADVTRRFLDLLEVESIRLSRLVADLLDLSRLESGLTESKPVRLDAVAIEESEKLRARAETAGLRLVVERSDRVTVSGSESDLGLMVHNLLDNAIRYTQPGGEVRISVRSSNGTVVMRVDDTGIGIPSADLDRVFERFYRVDEARSRQTGGTGLGLAIVRHVAEAHRGDVEVQSALGAGTSFIVRLPARVNPAADLEPSG